jgi:A/G-specific adenine glycosylase
VPHSEELAAIRSAIQDWYAAEHRDFPWRRTRDPYAVLVSEVMLQQTQASRVAQHYPRFLDRFPTVEALAAATSASVLAAWSGLGYNRRVIALQQAARVIAQCGWPLDVAGLERLPGVGPYTARAVASLAFGEPVGVVDTNVRRWLVRRFATEDRPRPLQALADELAALGSTADADAWTHATMEFGAAICRPRAPRCEICPIGAGCPSRGVAQPVLVPRQGRLHGSDRAYRGAVLRQLTATRRHSLAEEKARRLVDGDAERIGPPLDDAAWGRVVGGLERDGLVHRSGGRLRLGVATIGA